MASLYDMLEVDKKASADEIKKAFRKKALVHHPDKGGDKAVFQKLQEAYSVLSEPQKRAEYDQTGRVPQEGGGGGGGVDLSEMFGSMFGGGFSSMFGMPGMPGMPGMHGMPGMPGMPGMQGQRKPPRGPNKLHDIGVSLRDLYTGKSITLRFKRDVLCKPCEGKGGATSPCGACGGSGIRLMQQQMGPMIAMTQSPCGQCQQTGAVVTKACDQCGGKRLSEEEVVLEAQVKPGMKEGDRIVFSGKCSESPQHSEPGDVILVIREADSPGFRRDGDTLTCDIQISMAESLLGFSRDLDDHPSGSPVTVTSSSVIRHGDTLIVEDKGMPRMSSGHGPLIVRCMVTPCTFTDEQKELLKRVWSTES